MSGVFIWKEQEENAKEIQRLNKHLRLPKAQFADSEDTFVLWLPLNMNESNIGSLCGILCSVAGEGPPESATKQQGQSYYLRIDVYLGQSVISTRYQLFENLIRIMRFKHI